MKLIGTLEAFIPGPNGLMALIRCTDPEHEGMYIVKIADPGDRFTFTVNPSGDGILGEKLAIAPVNTIPPPMIVS